MRCVRKLITRSDKVVVMNKEDKEPKPKAGVLHKATKAMTFTLMDIVEDGVRVRLLNVWAFLLVYIFFVFGFLKMAVKVSPQVTQVRISTPMPHSMLAGKFSREGGDDGSQIAAMVTPSVAIFDQNWQCDDGCESDGEYRGF